MPGESLPFESIVKRRRDEEIAIYHARMRAAQEREENLARQRKAASTKAALLATTAFISQLENSKCDQD